MNLSRFFIDRPIFAGVLSVLIFLAGLIALRGLPISEYPEVAPPSVVVRAQYPAANPKVIAETVATQLEESINGVEGMRYNGYLAADVNGGPAPGFSSGQAQAEIERIAAETLPQGTSFEWTELTYQEILAGNSAVLAFLLAILLVFRVLAVQYESLTLPIAIILIVPMGLLAAMTGVWLTKGDNNVFTQIGLIVLVGLSAKNAILIVEFARRSPEQAAIEARRLRPILMTSLAFVMGVLPLVLSTGAGAEMRSAMGVTVFAGMIGVTAFGLFLTPVFYVLLRKLAGNRPLVEHGAHVAPISHAPHAAGSAAHPVLAAPRHPHEGA